MAFYPELFWTDPAFRLACSIPVRTEKKKKASFSKQITERNGKISMMACDADARKRDRFAVSKNKGKERYTDGTHDRSYAEALKTSGGKVHSENSCWKDSFDFRVVQCTYASLKNKKTAEKVLSDSGSIYRSGEEQREFSILRIGKMLFEKLAPDR